MNFTAAVASGLSGYVSWKGRSCRSEYWYWHLFFVIAYFAPLFLGGLTGGAEDQAEFVSIIIFVGLLLPTLSVSIRRLHDIDRAGQWYLLHIVPFGSIVLLVWACQKGSEVANRFGSNPLAQQI
jgi:uncharacterized membrane protein YhaH (DUF805 family)